ncbi:MAG: group 1 glycosyl transferase [uncultured bacterium]|uniref:Glycosyl transferase, group 1 n=3 Tax=Candidatus Daviesiibacteriota TaxID=1752718 RepID=A0A0G0HED2_9BACT|nr:MAG: group 1 glycosyl transferase [uncultured bacterium]KKQ10474.1 MAG: Glycosyl transferase, group 1 [Candidatus Daviesbacteria bacterium GW2011_GWB1_36_5]KKQ16206.1 MAG: Glycosyl transferase, group 1 [Candidatus Daviesbacteria bacterium GW2011_GWA1_36_8]OGE32620.1 MAG: hypothetical protein A3C99_02010 [Candidatus Daviesbacteria bacterium RIFCSPHIGHO2_02_FULL_37_9]OGE36181.1 MAG: hypothetical protein A3E66_05230 [Candidatus Daviesbacteria bacterium RIFCSPHIGHO2_12_FULL_37_16]
MQNLKVALVHDYLIEFGGAERVLEALHEMYPEAPIFTAFLDLNGLGPHSGRVKKWDIKTSWLQNFPFGRKLISPFRIFAPSIFESFDLKDYDLVISSCNTYFSKAVITKPEALHISYIHTPPRYLYGYTTSFNYKKHWWTRIAGEIANHFLRIYDFETSQRPDILVANSKNVRERIKKFYRRDAIVIYPPVDIKKFYKQSFSARLQLADRRDSTVIYPPVQLEQVQSKKEKGKNYFLSLGRLVRGKGTEIIVEAAVKLNLPLKVAGSGPELERLKKLAGKSVEFLGEISDGDLPEIYANGKALIVASEDEDFGITSVEAQSAGTPVIAVKAGGYLESIIEGKTGEFFDKADVDSLIKVLETFDYKKYKSEDLKKNAERFSKEKFKKEIKDLIEKNLKQD